MTTVNTDCEQTIATAAGSLHLGLGTAEDRFGSRYANPLDDAESAEIVHDFRNTLAAAALLSDLMELPQESRVRETT